MNPNNYASLEASRRLAEAGIVLETDHSWIWILPDARTGYAIDTTWRVQSNPMYGKLPAPSMAEVWRELPATVPDRELYAPMKLRKAGDGKTWGSYFRDGSQIIDSIKADINPTDALIELLIWARREASHE